MSTSEFKAVVIGSSAGGLQALTALLSYLPYDYHLPVIVVQHLHESSDNYLSHYLNENVAIKVKEALDKDRIEPGCVYIAPPGYHLLVEDEQTLCLSIDSPVHFSRPSIDVLFQSAAFVYGKQCVGMILTGANDDGSQGLKQIKDNGGLTLVQDPASAEFNIMPREAILATNVDHVLSLEQLGTYMQKLNGGDT